jgi:DNA-directed RNA polymerase specialized sigma24 family protein
LKYCSRETAAKQGTPLNRENFYNEEMLERALPFIFEAWPETTVRQNPRTGATLDKPFEFGNALAILADISGAYYGLPKDIQHVLEMRFRDGLTLEEIGDLREIGKEGARKLVQRCVKRLCDSLAGEKGTL